MNLTIQIPNRLQAEFEQRTREGKYVVIAHGALQGAGDTLEQVAMPLSRGVLVVPRLRREFGVRTETFEGAEANR